MFSDYLKGASELFEKIKKDKKSLVIICAAVLGMVLIMLSGTTDEKSKTEVKNGTEETYQISEEKLQKLLSKIKGAGRVSVIISYESGSEAVFAYDKDENLQKDEQRTKSDYIIVDGENGETGLKIKTVYPKIKGVAVVCDGADDPFTKEQIISVVSALFDISTRKISVVCAE